MQVEAEPIALDGRKGVVARPTQILHKPRRKGIGAAVDEIDHHASGGLIVMRSRGPQFGFEHSAAFCFGGLELRVSHVGHGYAPIPAKDARGARSPITHPLGYAIPPLAVSGRAKLVAGGPP